MIIIRIADLYHFNADQDPSSNFNEDLDPTFHFNADSDPDPSPHHSDMNLRLLVYKPSLLYRYRRCSLSDSDDLYIAAPPPHSPAIAGTPNVFSIPSVACNPALAIIAAVLTGVFADHGILADVHPSIVVSVFTGLLKQAQQI